MLDYILKRINYFVDETSRNYNISKIYLILDCMRSVLFTGCTVKEYFLLKLFLLNRNGRRQFIFYRKQLKIINKNDADFSKIFNDKEETLNKFSKFINRDWCGLKYHNTEEDYKNFVLKHSKGILKPLSSSEGKGIRIVELSSFDSNNENSLYSYCQKNKLIIEELIIQEKSLSKIYPNSVNTIRLLSYGDNVLGAIVKFGRGGSYVDNTGVGNMYAEVDIQTGIIVTPAYDYQKNEYLIHPDTNEQIIGFKIPMWLDLLNFTKEMNKHIEGVSLIGYDIAISVDGPALVEINESPDTFFMQHPRQRGFKKYFKN